MAGLRDIGTYSVDLAANGEVEVNASGAYLALLAQGGAFQVAFDDGGFQNFQSGLYVKLPDGEEFRKLRLRDTSGAANTIEFNIGYGELRDARLVVPSGLELAKSTALFGLPDIAVGAGATTTLQAANNARREIIIHLPATEAGPVRIGTGGSVGAAQGVMLPLGGSLTLETTAQVQAHNPNGVAVTVTALTVSD